MNDEVFVFAEEDGTSEKTGYPQNGSWNVLIVDDESDVHETTKRVLSDFEFEGRGLNFLHAFSGQQAKEIVEKNGDIAVILLDVVMETDESGLEVARFIREVLRNNISRIILRTGQPGKAPESRIIIDYDINDYKSKTELTSQKLFTTMVASIRSYRDLQLIERNRQGLRQVINSFSNLFEVRTLKSFTEGVLSQLLSLLKLNESSLLVEASAFSAMRGEEDDFIINAATGDYGDYVDMFVSQVIPADIQKLLLKAVHERQCIYDNNDYIGYFETGHGDKHLLFVSGCEHLTEMDRDLLKLFCNNVAIAFENILLNREIVNTQKEVVFTLGEVVESRSKETASHVTRVGEMCYMLGKKIGLSAEDRELLRMAAPLHDVGKIGISDDVLLKPGKLTEEEYEQIKTHSLIGFEILKNSKREIIKTAALIAHQHHEKWDGTGYPDGLKGEEIHLFGRIVGLVDVFDALVHSRCYREAMDFNDVISIIEKERGKHFDPALVDVFLDSIGEVQDLLREFPD